MATKLPLVVRKNIRDEFDSKKEDLVNEINSILGETYSLDINFQSVYDQITSDCYGKSNLGNVAFDAVSDFVYYLKQSSSSGGDDMIKSFNSLVSTKKITLVLDEKFHTYSGSRIQNGEYQIVYRPGDVGTNTSGCNSNLQKVIDDAISASDEPLISLTARLSIKDSFESKQEELLSEVKALLGESYTFDIDFPSLYKQIADSDSYGKNNLGTVVAESISDFIYYFKYLSQDDQDVVAKGFNAVVTSRKLRVTVDASFEGYSGCRVKDGVYEIVYKPTGFGTNLSGSNGELLKELDLALFKTSPKSLPLIAKLNIARDYDTKKKEITEKIAEQLGGNAFNLTVDFENLWIALVNAYEALPKRDKSEIDLEQASRNFGNFVHGYFESLAYYLDYQFKGDEMCIEEFVDVVSTKEIHLEIVDKLSEGRTYNDLVFSDGKAILRTVPKYFGTNISDAASDIMKAIG